MPALFPISPNMRDPNVSTGVQWIREIIAYAPNTSTGVVTVAAISENIIQLAIPVACSYLRAAIAWADDDGNVWLGRCLHHRSSSQLVKS